MKKQLEKKLLLKKQTIAELDANTQVQVLGGTRVPVTVANDSYYNTVYVTCCEDNTCHHTICDCSINI